MKVLFVVNDESISTSIVKKYQKQYKEIISYKNVYYFNAVIKELQKNKTYDRIVISEDLDEITSLNVYQKDKIIFDKLDNISDESVNSDGEDIPIILICNDRRNKSEEILVKLFGIGIYNALIGTDRTTDMVCKLINKPRSKKEAKTYYQLDSENVGYEKQDENYVSEVEIQNILRHFKRIVGDNEKIVESFKQIMAQYNKEQLKVIVAILPENIKSVLEEELPEYQNIAVKKYKNQSGSANSNKNKSVKGTSERLLELETNKKIPKQVVVPTTLEKSLYKKVNNVESEEMYIEENDIFEKNIENKVEEMLQKQSKKRGRPKKNIEAENVKEDNIQKKKGRPKKNVENEQESFLPGFDENTNDENPERTKNTIQTTDQTVFENDEEELENETYTVNNNVRKFQLENIEEDEEDEDDEDDYEEDKNKTNRTINNGFNFNAKRNSEFLKTDTKKINDDEYYDNYSDEIDPEEENIKENINQTDYNNFEKSIDKYDKQTAFKDDDIEALITGDKKLVTFVGTSKNGTSFLVNNIAQILSGMGIDTAILDATKNKNSYYTYTNDEEQLRRIAYDSINGLIQGKANGIRVNNNLTVYTGVPSKQEEINDAYTIMETLLKRHSIVLIDCDFDTPIDYFDKSQELYLIQTFDVLTIQPLTEFLRMLQLKNITFENKIRVILNKCLKIRGGSSKAILKGMSKYNNEDLTLMKDLFNVDKVKVVAEIPFDEDVYIKYLEGLINCEIKINGYPKDFKQRLNNLASIVYPLLPNKKKQKGGYNSYSNSFSSDMNNTLNNMRKKY